MIIKFKDQERTPTSHGKYFKNVILGKDIIPGLLQFASAEFQAGDIIEKHSHRSMTEVFYVVCGKIEIKINDVPYISEKDDSFIIKAGKEHSLKFLENTKIIYFNIADENIDT